MPTVEIIQNEQVDVDGETRRRLHLHVSDAGETYTYLAIVPDGDDIQAMLDARADELWRQASARGESPDPVQSNARRLRDYARTVENNAAEIRALYIATADLDAAGEDATGARFTSVAGVVNDWRSALQDRFHAGFNAEYGVDVGSIGLQNLTGPQRAQYLQYARSWATMYATLLAWASLS